MQRGPTRRALGLAAMAGLLATRLRAEEIIDLEWSDLVPKGEFTLPPELQGVVQHDSNTLAQRQPEATGVRHDWNGRVVRLSGFVVPLDYKGSGVTLFILVPYVGACIHVPPPPANQLVLVTTETPYQSGGMFEPVTVTGMFGAAARSTQLAEVGYALSADRIELFRG
ncbi:DUF3299 domain-containing protein [Halovulum sp. GXIMD14793]